MVTQFEDKWLKVPYLCVADHHLPETASSLFQAAFRYCLLDMSTQPPGQTAMLNLMSGLLKYSSQVYMTGVQALQTQLSPILCAKVFSAMKEVKQLLVVGDSFNERVHSPTIMPVQTLLDHKT